MTLTPLHYKLIAYTVALGLLCSGSYNSGKKTGMEEATAKYTKIIDDYTTNINQKIDNIETLAGELSKGLKETEIVLSKDLKTIIINSKKQPTTIIREGKCYPSPEYQDSVKNLHKRAQESLK